MMVSAVAFKDDYNLSSDQVWQPDIEYPHLGEIVPESKQQSIVSVPIPENATIAHYKILKRVNHLVSLPQGWDSYGAERIKKEAAGNVISLLWSCMEENTPFPSIVPISSGALQVEWHEFGIDLEIQVDDRGYYILNDSDETKNKNECLELIKELTGKATHAR